MYLLRYKRDGEARVVVIRDAYSVAHARMIAAELEPGRFVDGRQVDKALAARLPEWAVGRIFTRADLADLATGTKKPPAPSMRRRGASAPR